MAAGTGYALYSVSHDRVRRRRNSRRLQEDVEDEVHRTSIRPRACVDPGREHGSGANARSAPSKAKSSTNRGRCCLVSRDVHRAARRQTAVTDEEGEYPIRRCRARNDYGLKVDLRDSLPQERSDVTVEIGKTVLAEFTLKVCVVSGIRRGRGVRIERGREDFGDRHDRLERHAADTRRSTRRRRPGCSTPRPASTAARRTARRAATATRCCSTASTRAIPKAGSAWTFFNQNLIEEIQIGGLGAPAEYGGFTGRDHQHRDQVRRQRVLRAVLDALHRRLAGVEQRQRGRARRRTPASARRRSRRS